MIDVGRLCMKIAGRDAGKIGVVVDVIDSNTVLLDGDLRRRKVSKAHIEPLGKTIGLEKNASHEIVVAELKKAGYEVVDRKSKPVQQRPKKVRNSKKVEAKPAKKDSKKKADKKEESKPAKKEATKPVKETKSE